MAWSAQTPEVVGVTLWGWVVHAGFYVIDLLCLFGDASLFAEHT